MGRVRKLWVENYRSIRDRVEIAFPAGAPLVLIGENNAGKSNLVKALELLLGEFYPGNHEPEDHEFFDRDRNNGPIRIHASLQGVVDLYRGSPRQVSGLTWCFPPDEDRPFYMHLPGGSVSPYVSNDVRTQCTCFLIGADRRLAYQLGFTSKYTLIARLTRRFHDRLMSDTNRVERLQRMFGELRATFEEVEEFASFVSELKEQLGELSGNLAYGLDIDFAAYNPSNYFRSLRIQPAEEGSVRELEELGTGQEQILALSFAYAYAKTFHGTSDLLLVIEEPEAHLHPLAQAWVGKKIAQLAGEGVQVVVTTHSPAFLNMENLEGFVLVTKRHGPTTVTQLTREVLASFCTSTGARGATPDTVLPFYAAAATPEILSGLFARRIVLVEGPTEALALPVYLSKVGLEAARDGVAVIPVTGVGNLAKWWRLFRAYAIPAYVIFDNDAGQDDDRDGRKRSDILATIGIETERHAELLATTDWVVDDRFTIFGGNFEQTLRNAIPGYEQLEDEAEAQFGLARGQSKPLVARYVAERLILSDHEVSWQRFDRMAAAIGALE